jgi:acyl carrier protein
MISSEKVTHVILGAIDELNGQLPKEEKIDKSIDAALFGSDGKLDSLGLISLVTTVEQRIEENFEVMVTLLQDTEVLENENPFKTIKTLSDYVTAVLEKKKSE